MVPCGTPDRTGAHSDFTQFTQGSHRLEKYLNLENFEIIMP